MMGRLHTTCVAALALLLRTTSAGSFYIHQEYCNPTQTAFVRSVLTGSFAMASGGLAGSTAAPGTAQGDITSWLFGQTGNQYHSFMYNSVSAINTEVDSMDALVGAPRVIIYCNESRFKRRAKDPIHVYDESVQQVVGKTGSLACNTVTLAYTYQIPTNKKGIIIPSGRQIQICPWFLNYAMAQPYSTFQSLGTTFWGKLQQKGLPDVAKLLYTPIDFVSMADKVLLHELTHAIADGAKAAEDVGGFSGYGWKNCLGIAQKVTNAAAKTQGPEWNADTWALYGSATQLIQSGGGVLMSGDITAPAGTTVKIRDPEINSGVNMTEKVWVA